MTSPATMQMRTSAWRDAIGGASKDAPGMSFAPCALDAAIIMCLVSASRSP